MDHVLGMSSDIFITLWCCLLEGHELGSKNILKYSSAGTPLRSEVDADRK